MKMFWTKRQQHAALSVKIKYSIKFDLIVEAILV